MVQLGYTFSQRLQSTSVPRDKPCKILIIIYFFFKKSRLIISCTKRQLADLPEMERKDFLILVENGE